MDQSKIVDQVAVATGLDPSDAETAVRALLDANPHANCTVFAEVFQDNPVSARILTNAGFEFIDANEELNYALYRVGPYTVGNGTPRELDEGGSIRVLESHQWQHLPRRGAELTLDAIFTLGATIVGHELGDPPPVQEEAKPVTHSAGGKDAIKLLTQKQLRALTANAGAVAKAEMVKGKKIANVYGINGELLA